MKGESVSEGVIYSNNYYIFINVSKLFWLSLMA